jgi:hypothetical protein
VPDAHLPADFDQDTAQALARLVEQVIDVPSARLQFRQDPVATAEAADVPITDQTTKVILTLAELSPAELRLLSELNRVFIEEGLFVETGNPPLMVY